MNTGETIFVIGTLFCACLVYLFVISWLVVLPVIGLLYLSGYLP